MRRCRAGALALTLALGLAGAALAQDGAGIAELLRSARLWQSLDRPDTARRVLLKVLAVQADEPQALLMLGELELRSGRTADAQRHLARLRGNPAAADAARELQQLTRIYTQDKGRLAQLRLLRRGGNNEQALALARSLFPDGQPPGDLAAEFAPLLAGTPAGWDTMRRLLERRVAQGGGPRERLALYDLLAQRDQTLNQALSGYADLAQTPGTDRARVSEAWRRALARMPGGAAARSERQRYTQRFGAADAVAAAPARPATATGPATAAAAPGPTTAAAAASGREPQSQTSGTAASSAFWDLFRRARSLRDQGRIDEAAMAAAQAHGMSPREAEGTLLLADLRLRQGRPAEAEALYQALVKSEPANGRGWGGLLGIWLRDGRAEPALQRAAALAGTPGLVMADVLDTGALRDAADALLARRQAGRALRLLEAGVSLRPDDAWLRHDLARRYARLRLPTLALAVMDEGLVLRPTDPAMRHAAALVAAGADRDDLALANIDAVPEQQRSAGMRELRQRLRSDAVWRAASDAQGAGRIDEARRLRTQALADAGDDPEQRLRAAEAFADAGDTTAADAMMPTLLGRADWSAGASQRLLDLQRQLATLQIETLLQQGRPRDAAQHAHTAAQALKGGTPQARALAAARLHLAAGDPSSALPPLDGLINEAPDDPEPYLLRARVHEAMKNTEAARRDLLTMRALLPSDDVAGQLAAVRTIGADRGTARAWIAELLARHPQDDAVLLEAASQARRDGHYEQALQHLRRVTAAPVAGATLIAPNEVPLLIPRDPIVVATAAPRVDSPSRTRALASAREQIDAIESRRQPRVEAAWTSFSRRSSPGISTLHGSELPMLAVWAPGYDGHRFVQVDAVQLDADPLPAGFADAALFGKVRALAAGQDLAAPVAQRQRGLSAGVGWRGEDRRWDIGFVGAGLKVPNLVGGWRESGSWRHSDWSAEFSRRPLTGSLLSYAGAADPITGEVWGGIVNTSLAVRAARDLTPVLSASSSLRAGVLSGRNVRRNPMLQWRTAVERQWLLTPDLSVSVGLALSLWHYRHNEGFYTFGLGGYYSPQRYVGLALPVQTQGRWGRWSFDVRASVSQSATWEQDVPYHPTNAALQAAAGNAVHRGGRGGGFGYSLRGAVEYHLTPHLSLGTSLDLDRSDDYAPTRGMFYLRYLFPALTGAVPVPPRPVLPYSQY